jgi:hypothetical protein
MIRTCGLLSGAAEIFDTKILSVPIPKCASRKVNI